MRATIAIDPPDLAALLPTRTSRWFSPGPLAQGLQQTLEAVCLSTGALLVALLLFGLFVALSGRNPVAIYSALYVGAFASRFSLENTLTQSAPIMLTALCTAMPARVGLLVIGGEGALVLGGLFAVLAATAVSSASPWIGTLVALAGGTLRRGALDRRGWSA